MTLYMLRIEEAGHLRGQRAPKPWVAQILGPSQTRGFKREFIEPMRDWRDASKSGSGKTYGVVATFPLRPGLYEVGRLRGKPSKRQMVREYMVVDGGSAVDIESNTALAMSDGVSGKDGKRITVASHERVAEVVGLGDVRHLSFIAFSDLRAYWTVPGRVYERRNGDRRQLFRMVDGEFEDITPKEAMACLSL